MRAKLIIPLFLTAILLVLTGCQLPKQVSNQILSNHAKQEFIKRFTELTKPDESGLVGITKSSTYQINEYPMSSSWYNVYDLQSSMESVWGDIESTSEGVVERWERVNTDNDFYYRHYFIDDKIPSYSYDVRSGSEKISDLYTKNRELVIEYLDSLDEHYFSFDGDKVYFHLISDSDDSALRLVDIDLHPPLENFAKSLNFRDSELDPLINDTIAYFEGEVLVWENVNGTNKKIIQKFSPKERPQVPDDVSFEE